MLWFEKPSPLKLNSIRATGFTYLSADHALFEPRQIGLRPITLRPRFHGRQVRGEIEIHQLVVHELANVPRQIVVPGKQTTRQGTAYTGRRSWGRPRSAHFRSTPFRRRPRPRKIQNCPCISNVGFACTRVCTIQHHYRLLLALSIHMRLSRIAFCLFIRRSRSTRFPVN